MSLLNSLGKRCLLLFLFIWLDSSILSQEVDSTSPPLPPKEKQELLQIELGDSLFQEEQYPRAYLQYEEFLEIYPNSIHNSYVLKKMAQIQEIYQDYETAIQLYERLYTENIFTEKGVEYLFDLARLYDTIGDKEKAQKNYQVITEQFPDSLYAQKASNRLALSEILSK